MKVSLTDTHVVPASDGESSASTGTSSIASFNLRRGKPAWQEEIVDLLCRFLQLPEDWDTYGGRPLRHDTAMFTLQVLNNIMTPATPVPHIVPIANGGVQVEWHQNSLDIELYVAAPYDCELFVNDQLSG